MGREDQPQSSIGPEQDSRPNSEIPKPTLLQFSLREKNASEADKRRIWEMNVLLKGLSIIGYFAKPFKQHPLEESEVPSANNPQGSERLQWLHQDSKEFMEITENFLKLIKMEKVDDIEYQRFVIRHITGSNPEAENVVKLTNELKQDFADRIEYTAKRFLSADPEIKTIEVDSSQIDVLAAKFYHIFHDLNNPLTSIIGWMSLYTMFAPVDDQFTLLEDAVNLLINNYDTLEKSLGNIYDKESLKGYDIFRIADRILTGQPHDASSLHIDLPENLREVSIVWSKGWAELLFEDIAQNIRRSFAVLEEQVEEQEEENKEVKKNEESKIQKQINIRFKRVNKNGKINPKGKFVEIDIEDNGVGIPPELLGGFKEGVTNWHGSKKVKGTGYGMAPNAEILQAHYDGELSAENILGENGEVKGARIKIRIPISSPQS